MCECQTSKIVLNTTTLEKIAHDPASILRDEESFWAEEKPQQYTRRWAEMVNYTLSYDKWREEMKAWAELSLEQRLEHPLMRTMQTIVDGKDAFLAKALPHLCSFLPEDADLSITVHFTAFVPPYAWAIDDIFVNVSSPYWNGNVQNILNILVHEIFHVGYGYCWDRHTDARLANETAHKMLNNLFNEGVCTYVGYRVLPLFPAPDEKDYRLLADPAEVKRLTRDLNSVLAQVGVLPDQEVQKLTWDLCIAGRAFYIVGAHMCRTIDDRRGRAALIDTLLSGPVSFLNLYNSLVEQEAQILMPA